MHTMAKTVAITTIDNPFDPIDEFDAWFAYDNSKGYGTCSYLARVTKTSDSFPEEMQIAETERAIDEIIENDFMHMYKKIVR